MIKSLNKKFILSWNYRDENIDFPVTELLPDVKLVDERNERVFFVDKKYFEDHNFIILDFTGKKINEFYEKNGFSSFGSIIYKNDKYIYIWANRTTKKSRFTRLCLCKMDYDGNIYKFITYFRYKMLIFPNLQKKYLDSL